MSLLAHEERDIENMQADFDMFLAKEDWKNAQIIIDNLWDLKQDVLAEASRRALLREQSKDWDNEGKLNDEERESDHSDFVERQGGSYLD